MDITLIGRGASITDRFRDYATEKSERVEHLADRALALEIRLCRHHETHGTHGDDRVELTLIGPGPVIRAEAGGVDKYAAFDAAHAKLMEHVRRAKDRKKVHRGHGSRLTSLRAAAAADFRGVGVVPADGDALRWAETGGTQPQTLPVDDQGAESRTDGEADDTAGDYSPMVIRRKTFTAAAMSVDDALYRMELVGHDFYLFVDSTTHRASAVYRRIGWDYGVIDIDEQDTVEASVPSEAEYATS